MYLTFEEYIEMGGTLDNATFTRMEFRAIKEIDRYTFNRLQTETTVRESVKRLTYEIIIVAVCTQGNQVTASNNDGVSQNYQIIDFNTVVSQLINTFLACETTADGTMLLYRGM